MRRRGLVIARVTHVCCENAFECSRCNPIFVEEIVASYASVWSLFICEYAWTTQNFSLHELCLSKM